MVCRALVQVSKLNSIKAKYTMKSSLQSHLWCLFVTLLDSLKKQERSSIEINFLYLIVSILYLAPPEKYWINHFWFADVVSLIYMCFLGWVGVPLTKRNMKERRIIIIDRISKRKPKLLKRMMGFLLMLHNPISVRRCCIFIFSKKSKLYNLNNISVD